MLFQLIAPFYDRFMKLVKLDHSSVMAQWLSPVEGMDLLDLAGGTGINAVALAGAGARVTVVDASGAMLSRARSKKANINIIRADAAILPLPDSSFDIILVSDAWHHFREQDMVAAEAARVLRPGGRVYVIDFDRGKFRTKYLIALERMLGEPSNFMSPQELEGIFKSRGISGEFRYLTSNQYIYKGHKDTPVLAVKMS
ncbi:MAG: class I SAM-dependent methyltransferase [Bacillota bacterium]